MSKRHTARWLVPIVSAFGGVCCAAAFMPSCSMGSGCDCSEPRHIVEGEFESVSAEFPEAAPSSLQDIDVTRLVIADGTLVVHYTRGDEPGAATFTFGNM